jgi:5-methylcytosine-specific restriction endonuclease McrA
MADLRDLSERANRLAEAADRELWTLVAETASVLKELNPGPPRRLWLQSVVNEMWDAQGGACAICGSAMRRDEVDVDHRIPFCYGGGHERENLQLAHPSCNRSRRSGVDPRDLLRYLESRYMNR